MTIRMNELETIRAKTVERNGYFEADYRYGSEKDDRSPFGRRVLRTRACWSAHPIDGTKPAPVWPVKTEA